MTVDIHDVIKCATYCDDRLRGLGVARGRISRFPIDLRRRPYNTLALPCECVIWKLKGREKCIAAAEFSTGRMFFRMGHQKLMLNFHGVLYHKIHRRCSNLLQLTLFSLRWQILTEKKHLYHVVFTDHSINPNMPNKMSLIQYT